MTRLLATLLLLAFIAAPARATATSAARTKTEDLLAAFARVKTDGPALTAKERDENARAVAELERAFDFPALATTLLSSREAKFTPAQHAAFEAKFHDLVKASTFVDSGAFFRKAKLEWHPERAIAERVAVPVRVTIPAEDVDLLVEIVWRTEASGLRVADVLLDGDSLVKDYQNQLARLVDKKGADGLLATIDEKLAAIRKPK